MGFCEYELFSIYRYLENMFSKVSLSQQCIVFVQGVGSTCILCILAPVSIVDIQIYAS